MTRDMELQIYHLYALEMEYGFLTKTNMEESEDASELPPTQPDHGDASNSTKNHLPLVEVYEQLTHHFDIESG
uniref:Uncharacterized protein n=1 Tax=Amphimedon queenslandica TaxID=400682 RepID=A0A1X7TWU9_AMPQE